METKRARGAARAVVTRKVKEIIELMKDENNLELVNEKSARLQEAFENFRSIHEVFHVQLSDVRKLLKNRRLILSWF